MVNPPVIRVRSLTQLIAQFSKRNQALPCPVIQSHSTLPEEVPFDLSMTLNGRHFLTSYDSHLKAVSKAARSFFMSLRLHFFKKFLFI